MADEITVDLPDEPPRLSPRAAAALWRLLRAAQRRSCPAEAVAPGAEGEVSQPDVPSGKD